LETALILAGEFGVPVIQEPGLGDIVIPQWDGRLKKNLEQDSHSRYDLWKRNPAEFSMAGAESLQAVTVRSVEAMERIPTRHQGEAVAAVSHLAVLRCLAIHYTGADLMSYRDITITPHPLPSGAKMVNII
jgi:broad specificity phosphatase PhoE